MKDVYQRMTEQPASEERAPRAFYERPKKRIVLSKRRLREEARRRKEQELADELAKPPEQRVGKLRSLKSGDFSEEEMAELRRRYER